MQVIICFKAVGRQSLFQSQFTGLVAKDVTETCRAGVNVVSDQGYIAHFDSFLPRLWAGNGVLRVNQ